MHSCKPIHHHRVLSLAKKHKVSVLVCRLGASLLVVGEVIIKEWTVALLARWMRESSPTTDGPKHSLSSQCLKAECNQRGFDELSIEVPQINS